MKGPSWFWFTLLVFVNVVTLGLVIRSSNDNAQLLGATGALDQRLTTVEDDVRDHDEMLETVGDGMDVIETKVFGAPLRSK